MKSWNEPLNIIREMKEAYIDSFGNDGILDFEVWLEKLNNKRYNDIFSCLQVNQMDNLILIRYGLQDMQKSMWEDENSIYRECRSLVLNLDKEEIVLAPFRKFFNLNEVEENKIEVITEKIKNAKSVEISDKLDGPMQSARWYNDDV